MNYNITLIRLPFTYQSLDTYDFLNKKFSDFVTIDNISSEDVSINFTSPISAEVKGLKKEKTANANYLVINDTVNSVSVSYWYITEKRWDLNLDNPILKIQLDVIATFGNEINTNLRDKDLFIERAHIDRFKVDGTSYVLSDKLGLIFKNQEFEKGNFSKYFKQKIDWLNTKTVSDNVKIDDYHYAVFSKSESTKIRKDNALVDIKDTFSTQYNAITNTERSSSFDGILAPLNLKKLQLQNNVTKTTKYWYLFADGVYWKNHYSSYQQYIEVINVRTTTDISEALRFNTEIGALRYYNNLKARYRITTNKQFAPTDQDLTFNTNDAYSDINFINKYLQQGQLVSIFSTPIKRQIDVLELQPLSKDNDDFFVFGSSKRVTDTSYDLIIENERETWTSTWNFDFFLGSKIIETKENTNSTWDWKREIAIYNEDNLKIINYLTGSSNVFEFDYINYFIRSKNFEINATGYYSFTSVEGYFNVLFENQDKNNITFFTKYLLSKLPVNSNNWDTYINEQGNSYNLSMYQAKEREKITKAQAGLSIFSGIASIFGGGIAGKTFATPGTSAGARIGAGLAFGAVTGASGIASGVGNLQTADFERRKIEEGVKDKKNQFDTISTADNYFESLVGEGDRESGYYTIWQCVDEEIMKSKALYYHKFGYQINLNYLYDEFLFNRSVFNFIQIQDVKRHLSHFDNVIANEIERRFNNGIRLWKDKFSFLNYNKENWEKEVQELLS